MLIYLIIDLFKKYLLVFWDLFLSIIVLKKGERVEYLKVI